MAPGLIADWALWGKVPRTTSGYEVLAAHPPGRSAEFNTAVLHWLPGTPGAGDRLPWITVGCAPQAGGEGTVGVFLLDGTDGVDGTNRMIHRVSHFTVPYAQVREAGVGWCALARAARTAAETLTLTTTGPAALPLGEDERLVDDVAGNVTPNISGITRWLAAAAAHLLDGPVAVAGDGSHRPFELLLILDSVAALLPFGVRSTLSAASATSPGSEVPVRLYWGDTAASPGATGLTVGGGPLPDLRALSPQARRYHDLLLDNWEKNGGAAVVRHLADCREALDIDDPDAAAQSLEVLKRLDQPLAAVQAFSEGREVSTEEVHVALRSPGITDQELTVFAEHGVLTHPDTDPEAVAPLMSQAVVSQAIRDRLRGDLLDRRTDAARREFENRRASLRAAGLTLRPLDEILAGVISEILHTRPEGTPDPVTGELLPAVAPFAVGTMDLTQSMLRQVPGLASGLVRALYDQPEPVALVGTWLRWLCDDPSSDRWPEKVGGPELPLIRALLSTGVCPVEADRKWAGRHPAAAARLLEAAVVCGRGDEVLRHADFFKGLVSGELRAVSGADGDEVLAVLRDTLRRGPAGLRAATAARWDVLCALIGLPPSGFTDVVAAGRPAGGADPAGRVDTYASALRAELDSRVLKQDATRIVRELLRVALAVDPESGYGPGPADRELTERVLDWSGPYAQLVVDAVHRLVRTPYWNESEQDGRWLDRLAGRLSGLGSSLALRSVVRFAERPEVTEHDCGELAVRARAARVAGAENDDVCAALVIWAVRGRIGERLDALLAAYQKEWASYSGAGRALEERHDMEDALARYEGDQPVAEYYCDHRARHLAQTKSRCLREIEKLKEQLPSLEREISRMHKLRASAVRTRV
ncbi:hypothetical protein ACF1B0_06730 [Streptomyces anandii]|uniref:hypothetical protein n=1 Tax=Streptomyces anandii TaxID=285454 RepID=UPI0036F84811